MPHAGREFERAMDFRRRIEEGGEGVDGGLVRPGGGVPEEGVQPPLSARLHDGDGGLVGEEPHAGDIGRAETFGRALIEEFEDTDDFAFEEEGHAEEVPGVAAHSLRDGCGVAGVGRDAGHRHRLTGSGDEADNSGAGLEPPMALLGIGLAEGHLEDQLLRLRVDEEERSGLGAEDAGRRLDNEVVEEALGSRGGQAVGDNGLFERLAEGGNGRQVAFEVAQPLQFFGLRGNGSEGVGERIASGIVGHGVSARGRATREMGVRVHSRNPGGRGDSSNVCIESFWKMTQDEQDRYELREELGRGGTASVVHAYDRVLERDVALKVLSGPIANDPEFMSRFEREARLAARLDHPNIVTIYDFGRFSDGRGFIAMRLLVGRGLEKVVASEWPLPAESVASIVSQVAHALDYTHSMGMVHRDVKPNNVIIDPKGRATLTDFGIARAFDSARVTMTGLSIGTPRYMAPEQIRGEDVTSAADVYALGVMTFELLAGRGPFEGEGTALMYKIVHERPPAVDSLNSALSTGVSQVVAKALAKEPGDRWPSAGEFAEALGAALLGTGRHPVVPSPAEQATLVSPARFTGPNPVPPIEVTAASTSAAPSAPPTVRGESPDRPPAAGARAEAATAFAPRAAEVEPTIERSVERTGVRAAPPREHGPIRKPSRPWYLSPLALLGGGATVLGGGLAIALATGAFGSGGGGGEDTSDDRDSGSAPATVSAGGGGAVADKVPNGPAMTTVAAGETHTCGLTTEGTIKCWGSTAGARSTPPEGTFSQVSAGRYHSCALKSDQSVVCWGFGGNGQKDVPAGTFVAVAAGGLHSCGILRGGKVVCWGSGGEGQTRPPSGSFSALALGWLHSCGLLESGEAACWGNNGQGQATPPKGKFISLSAGDEHTCGIREGGAIECWGANGSQQGSAPPAGFIQVAAGEHFTCGIRQEDGGIACWGDNNEGKAIPPKGEFSNIAVGWRHGCAVRIDQQLVCWGTGGDGRASPPEGAYQSISAGTSHGCGVLASGAVACWGSNRDGEATPPAGNFKAVSAGGHHSCGIREDGTVACWGRAAEKQAEPPAGQFATISAGEWFTCGIKVSGEVACWGRPADFAGIPAPTVKMIQVDAGVFDACGVTAANVALCWGATTGRGTPADGERGIWMTAGDDHGCEVTAAASLACWGYNPDGRATGPKTGSFATVTAAWQHTCALQANGDVTCFGADNNGQASPPAGKYIAVSAGRDFTCGVKQGGAAVCWGWDREVGPTDAFKRQ